jgi:hypothetical protein
MSDRVTRPYQDDFVSVDEVGAVVAAQRHVEELEPIWWNRFIRNLRIKPIFVSFEFVIMNLNSFKIP